MFNNRTLVIATMHGKEQVIAPLLAEAFNITTILPELLNTDVLGTFSGDVMRDGSPLEVARMKCLLAMKETECDLAIASEGSFGAHPTIPFIAGDDELVLLMDRKNGFEIFGRKVSTETNLGGETVMSIEDAKTLALKFGFPQHGLIIRDKEKGVNEVHKGIQDAVKFDNLINRILLAHGSAWIETDMRASFNPTRMEVIKQATQNLISKMKSKCPECETPGFSISKAISGLPCSVCSMPTMSTLSYEYRCSQCEFSKHEYFPHSKTKEEPMYCDFCNP